MAIQFRTKWNGSSEAEIRPGNVLKIEEKVPEQDFWVEALSSADSE